MNFVEYLQKSQPLVYQTFSNALKNGRISHAYLLSGEAGTPLLETAIFLAKSIVCEHPSPLCDDTCKYCSRIDHRTYSGFRIIGENEGTIKKEEVEDLISSFSKTPLEEKNECIYIIHQVENMTVEAVNALLKFLEEPPSYVHAILTTSNVAKVLPTIVSRCETIRLLLAPRKEVIEKALASGASKEDAELLSYFYNNGLAIPEMAKEEDYLAVKKAFIKFLNALPNGRDPLYLVSEKDIIPVLKDKKTARMFFDMLSLALKDAISLQENAPILLSSYAKIITPLERLLSLMNSLLETMKVRNLLELNISSGILLEHLIYYFVKENRL